MEFQGQPPPVQSSPFHQPTDVGSRNLSVAAYRPSTSWDSRKKLAIQQLGQRPHETTLVSILPAIFHRFSSLPTELRREIWKQVASHPRKIDIKMIWGVFTICGRERYRYGYVTKTRLPPLLHVNQEARREGLFWYARGFGKLRWLNDARIFSKRLHIYINAQIDIVSLSNSKANTSISNLYRLEQERLSLQHFQLCCRDIGVRTLTIDLRLLAPVLSIGLGQYIQNLSFKPRRLEIPSLECVIVTVPKQENEPCFIIQGPVEADNCKPPLRHQGLCQKLHEIYQVQTFKMWTKYQAAGVLSDYFDVQERHDALEEIRLALHARETGKGRQKSTKIQREFKSGKMRICGVYTVNEMVEQRVKAGERYEKRNFGESSDAVQNYKMESWDELTQNITMEQTLGGLGYGFIGNGGLKCRPLLQKRCHFFGSVDLKF